MATMASKEKSRGHNQSPLLPYGAHDDEEKRALLASGHSQAASRGGWTNRLIAASLAIIIATIFSLWPASPSDVRESRSLHVSFSSHRAVEVAASRGSDIFAQVPDYDGVATLSWSDGTGSDSDVEAQATASIPSSLLQGVSGGRLVWLTREVVDQSLLSRRPHDQVKLLCEPPVQVKEHALSHSGDICSHPHAGDSSTPYVDSIFEDHIAPCTPPPAPRSATSQPQTTSVLLQTNRSSLLFVPHSRLAMLDHCLPPFVRPYILPPLTSTLPSASPITNATAADDKPEPVYPSPRLDDPFVSTWLRSPLLQSHSRIQQDLDALTGENASTPSPLPGKPRWTTRHSSTYGGYQAATWLLEQQHKALGNEHGTTCDFWKYGDGSFNPNVVCVIPGQEGEDGNDAADHEEGAVILSAHYDSRGSFGSPLAPGGDDDGSGTAMLLAVTRVLGQAMSSQHRLSHRRRRPLHIILFSGEEQGLVGSHYYAAHLRNQSIPVRLALQTDMVAYRAPGEPLQLAFPDLIGTRSAAAFVRRTAELWAPQSVVGETPVCCSDHQSFWSEGFPATWVFERNGPIADPRYHDSGDVSKREGYDLEQLVTAGEVVLASALQLLWE